MICECSSALPHPPTPQGGPATADYKETKTDHMPLPDP